MCNFGVVDREQELFGPARNSLYQLFPTVLDPVGEENLATELAYYARLDPAKTQSHDEQRRSLADNFVTKE